MASKNTHDVFGALAGGAVAAVSARDQQSYFKIVEVLGGAIGGIHGARIPDALEPALTPRHRGPVHSIVAGVGGIMAARKYTPKPVEWLRQRATELAASSATEGDLLPALLQFYAAVACHFAAGYLVGLSTGFGSHLALDAVTPESLPLLIGRG